MKKTTDSSVPTGKEKKTQTTQNKNTTTGYQPEQKSTQGKYAPEISRSVQEWPGDTKKRAASGGSSEHNGLRGLLEGQLQDIYWAEKAFAEALPKLIGNATSRDLVKALNQQLDVTERQVTRCENVFEKLHLKPMANRSAAMEGLIREANGLIDSTVKGAVRDAGIICATQKVDHYKIATYGTLTAFANHLGEIEAAQLLRETLKEEKEGDQILTQVTKQEILEAAAAK